MISEIYAAASFGMIFVLNTPDKVFNRMFGIAGKQSADGIDHSIHKGRKHNARNHIKNGVLF